MRKYKKLLGMILAASLAGASMAGCGGSSGGSQESAENTGSESAGSSQADVKAPGNEESAAENPGNSAAETGTSGAAEGDTRIVVDHTGREIEIPAQIDRIVISSILPLPSVYCLFEGSAEKLVGIHPSSMAAAQNSILPKVVPDIVDVNTDFLQGDEINVEELLKLDPDVVFYSADNTAEYEKLTAAGIPAVGFSTSNWDYDCVATFENWVKLLGEVLQQQDKAAGIADYGYEVYDEIQTVLNEAGDDLERPKALILFHYGEGTMRTSGSNFFGQYWLDSTGAVNVAESLSGTPEINMEQVYAWNPSLIFITNFTTAGPEDLYQNTVGNYDWSVVDAVQNQRVYKMPLGMYRSYTPGVDTPITLLWLAQTAYPELFDDIDITAETKAYYQEVFGIELTDEQANAIFSPAAEAGSGF